VQDVSLKISEGGCLALLGPTGCGKTTLLKIIAGLERPDSGQVLYNHIPLEQVPISTRGIGMVFQDYALIPNREAGYSVGFFLRLRHREREVPERVRNVSQITGVGIEHLMGKMPRHLSGGEKQRVAIARAFARDLDLLLLDEPFGSLDAKFRSAARVELKRLLNEYPVTTVLVTHDQQEASSLADGIAVMREGRIVQVGTYDYLYDNPVNRFVAEFIGVPTINLFYGRVEQGLWQGRYFGSFPVPPDVADGTELKLGVRAEHIYVDPQGIPAVVESVMPHYSERFLVLEMRRDDEMWEMKVALDYPVQRGETLRCVVDPAHILYFHPTTDERLLRKVAE
jgi:ABC-type sugar transport system ATPase subunit